MSFAHRTKLLIPGGAKGSTKLRPEIPLTKGNDFGKRGGKNSWGTRVTRNRNRYQKGKLSLSRYVGGRVSVMGVTQENH